MTTFCEFRKLHLKFSQRIALIKREYFHSKYAIRTMSTLREDKVSAVYRKLRVGPMKGLYKYITPSSISLAGGLPMDSCFPIKKIDVHLDNDINFSLINSQDLLQNYHRGDGIPGVKSWIHQHVHSLHSPKEDTDTCVTVGSTDSWMKILDLIDTECVLFDQYAYGASVAISETVGKRNIGIATDSFGMIPSSLRDTTLAARAKGLKVNLVYLVPVGQNPTGTTMPESRKREIYEVCKELDLIIVEDDAYYYLYFDLSAGEPTGLKSLPVSLLSMDMDGRVLRLDSLSKFVAPGMRMGWISGPKEFVAKYMLLQEATTQFPSGLSQSIFQGIVTAWGPDGLQAHVVKTQRHYRDQSLAMVSALKEFLPDPQVCQYTLPTGGMFMWLSFPSLKLTSFELFEALSSADVVCVPGSSFFVPGFPNDNVSKEIPAVRVTYAAATPEKIREGIKRLATCINNLTK